MQDEEMSIVAPIVGGDTDLHDALATARKANAIAVIADDGGRHTLHLVHDLEKAGIGATAGRRLGSLAGRVLRHGELLTGTPLGGITEAVLNNAQDLIPMLGTYYVCPKDKREIYRGPGKCRRHHLVLVRQP